MGLVMKKGLHYMQTLLLSLKWVNIQSFQWKGSKMGSDSMRAPGVRITHIPTDITVECSGHGSREKNHELALKVLRAKLYAMQNLSIVQSLRIEHGSGDYLRWPSYDIQGVMDGIQPEDK